MNPYSLPIHFGFTGTKDGMTTLQQAAVTKLLNDWMPEYFHHGDCVGADAQAHDIARSLGIGIRIVVHPPTDDKHRAFKQGDETRAPKAYLDRNHDIVRESMRMIAAPKTCNEQLRSGTWATIRYALKRGVPVFIVYPDGEIVRQKQGR